MERKLQVTSDGSHTIAIPDMNVTYHSRHGAIQESMHVFIKAGWDALLDSFKVKGDAEPECINILEMGFGTGLNALLTLQHSHGRKVYYESLEKHPLPASMAESLNYAAMLNDSSLEVPFARMHSCAWDEPVGITQGFTLFKSSTSLLSFQSGKRFHLIFFDAFAPNAQPELWTPEVFTNLFNHLLAGGILVTYCSKGDVRRALQAAGFKVEKIPGPPGKREMLRARKSVD